MARPAKKSEAKRNLYKGVDLDKVNEESLVAYLSEQGIGEIQGGSDDPKKNLIDVYLDHIDELKTRGGVELVEHDLAEGECGAMSLATLDACPVCGRGDNEEEVAAESAVAVSEEQDQTAIVTHGAEVVETLATVEELDTAVVKIKELVRDSFRGYWQLGAALADARDRGLWKARKNEDGSPMFKGFEEWSEAECELSARHVRHLCAVATMFDEATAQEIGFTKLTLILRASKIDPNARARLLEKARETNAKGRVIGKKELAQEAERILPKDKERPKVIANLANPPKRHRDVPEPKRKPGKGELTVSFQLGKVELRLQQGPKDHIFIARQTLLDGVEQSFTIDLKKKSLLLETKRGE